MILYHGSKSGIKGQIAPGSRERCDFGKGFYLGDIPEQPQGLIAEHKDHVFYEIDFQPEGLNTKEFRDDYADQIDWALFIAYNRDKTLFTGNDILIQKYEMYNNTYDVIIGLIADDSMIPTLTQFFNGDISDKVMLECLKMVRLGKQYVLKTAKACSNDHIKIISSRTLTFKEKKMATAQASHRKDRMSSELSAIKARYRRDPSVKYFDEIIEECNKC